MPLEPDDPAMIAWEKFKKSKQFDLAKSWAVQEDYTVGALWSAFYEGYCSGKENNSSR